MKKLITIVLMMISIASFAQKKQLVESVDNIVNKAVTELDSVSSGPAGALYKEITESGIKGHYVFDITIREKGFVATVFVVNETENPVYMQNRLKDLVKRYRFSFKVPKGKSYKFQYTFHF